MNDSKTARVLNDAAPGITTRVARLLGHARDLGLPSEKSTNTHGCWRVILDDPLRQRMLNLYTAPNQGAEVYLIDDGTGFYEQISQARARTEMDAAAAASQTAQDEA